MLNDKQPIEKTDKLQPLNANVNKPAKPEKKEQLVRYKKGQTATDINGNVVTEKNLFGKDVPLKTVEGEPENGIEYASEMASKMWDSGKSNDEADADMRKKYKVASTLIDKDKATEADTSIEDDQKRYQYYMPYEADGMKYYISPTDYAEIELARTYGLNIDDKRPLSTLVITKPSVAAKIINSDTKLKNAWEAAVNGDRSVYNYMNGLSYINDLAKQDYKKMGFKSKSEYDTYMNYLAKSWNKFRLHDNKDEKQEKTEAPAMPAKQVVEKKPVKAEKQEKTEAPEDIKAMPVKTVEEESPTESLEEKAATEKAVQLANYIESDSKNKEEVDEKNAYIEESRKAAEDATQKAIDGMFEYEDWLKNPSIMTGIFGKSGLSAARRVGLGAAALFSIFSDAVANYAKGINNNTDFNTLAMDKLNSTINTIQGKRAEKIGEMAARPYETTADNEAKLNTDYEKLRRTYAGAYIPRSTMLSFIQEAQINPDKEMDQYFLDNFNAASKEGFIKSLKGPEAAYYLDQDGELNPSGEAEFLSRQLRAIKTFKNVMNISPARIDNAIARLDTEQKAAETRKKIHDVNFQVESDYINAVSNMEAENAVLAQTKADFTSKRTLDGMNESLKTFKDAISGLASSSSNTMTSENERNKFAENWSKSNQSTETNETLKKHGWSIDTKVGVTAGIPSIGKAEGALSQDWSREQAERYVKQQVETAMNSQARDNEKARSLSNASGETIDKSYDRIMNFLTSAPAKASGKELDKVRKEILEAIDRKIEYNNKVIEELNRMREKERFMMKPAESPFMSMFNDVPTKNADYYRHKLQLT